MKAKVYVYADNGNDVILKSIDIIPVQEHIYYIPNEIEYYKLILEYNQKFYLTPWRISKDQILKLSFDNVLEKFKDDITRSEYFNNILLLLIKDIDNDLYIRASGSRAARLQIIEKEEEERRQAERYPVPASQKALTWISKRRYLVPLLLSIFKLHKGDPTNASTGAISEALLANQEPTCKRYWGTVFQEDIPNISDLFYAIGTMPPAWKSAALAM